MKDANTEISNNDPFNLNRFITAQEQVYQRVLTELNSGQKRSHWMWYIFPQLRGLAQSTTSQYYGIKNREEAIAYLNHPILGSRLRQCAEIVNQIKGKTVSEIFAYPDDLKLKSSMTLFSTVADEAICDSILARYFQSQKDFKTLQILDKIGTSK